MLGKCVFLLVVFVSLIKSSSAEHPGHPGFVRIRTVYLYLIGFFMILMFLIIIGLIYVIWRQRYRKFKRLSTHDAFVKYDKGDYVRQDSNDVRSLRKINSFENPYSNESTLTINSAIVDVVDNPSPLQSPARIENSIRFNPRRRTKKVHDETIMQKEQIDQIIKNTLSKNGHDETASLRNLNELLSETNKKEDKSPKTLYDKAASTPDLDVYDVLPAPRTPVKIISENEYDTYPPLYDCPPMQNNIIIPVMEGRYVIPISNEETQTEPSYINAHVRRFKK